MVRPSLTEPSQCAAEVEGILKALDDPAFTPEAFARSVTKQIAAMSFAPERLLAVRSELLVFERLIRTHGNDDAVGLRHAALQLLRSMQSLTRPIVTPTPAEVVRRHFAELQEVHGWASPTIELLSQDLKVGEKIVSCAADGIKTDQRRIDRRELIDRYRPNAMTDDHLESWRKMHRRPEFISRNQEQDR